jgi:hypothetical protein
LNVMGMNIAKSHTLLAARSNRPAPVHIGVESGMSGALATPSHAADLEHPYYYPEKDYRAAAGGMTGVETRGTTPLKASSIDTL